MDCCHIRIAIFYLVVCHLYRWMAVCVIAFRDSSVGGYSPLARQVHRMADQRFGSEYNDRPLFDYR